MNIFGPDSLISFMTKVIFHYFDVHTLIGTSYDIKCEFLREL
jgi:hypothetical protein